MGSSSSKSLFSSSLGLVFIVSCGSGGAAASDGGPSDGGASDSHAPETSVHQGDASETGTVSDGGQNRIAAVAATANHDPACTAIEPFYWELGDQSSVLASGSVGKSSTGAPVTGSTQLSIASASKWVYGMYVVQSRGSATGLMAAEIPFLNFTSGYTNMGSDTTTSQCPKTDDPDTVDQCLTVINSKDGEPYSYQDPSTVGKFDYDSGHLQNHARIYGSTAADLGNIGNVVVGSLGTTVAALLGGGADFAYTEPLLAGGIYTSGPEYGILLRRVLGGELFMLGALGSNLVCTTTAAPCNAAYTPLVQVAWHYSIAHWVEDDAATNGDGAFSSPGAFGFYPWIDSTKTYYGVISREESTTSAIQNGYKSARCGRMLRQAWVTGTEQTTSLYP
jgi:hypothetical protein